MDSLSLSLAFLAGNLAAVNPCGFAMLPAFLSFYVGAEDGRLPSVGSRLGQGLAVGLTVTAAFLGVFTLVGIPLALGARVLVQAMPWLAIVVGVVLALIGVAQLLGRRLTVPMPRGIVASHERRFGSFFLFGVAYAVASLGCTLPVFLSAVGTSFASSGPLGAVAVFATYGAGMGTMVIALSISAALLRGGLTVALRRLMPHFSRLTGAVLVIIGIYLIAYWSSALAGPAFLGNPVLEFGGQASATAENWLIGDAGRWFIAGAMTLILAAIVATALRSRVRDRDETEIELAAERSSPRS